MVTLVSDNLFSQLPQPSHIQPDKVILKGLAEVPVQGRTVPNINIKLGHNNYKWNVCVAPMSDNVILGLDFLKAHLGLVDVGRNVVAIDGQVLPAKLKLAATYDQIEVRRVHVSKMLQSLRSPLAICNVPSIVLLATNFVFEPLPCKNGALISSVFATGNKFNTKVINDSDTYLSFKKGRLIGLAEDCTLLPSPVLQTALLYPNTEYVHSTTHIAGPTSNNQYSETSTHQSTTIRKMVSTVQPV